MKNENTPTVKKTIACTPANAKEMKQIVKNWPELHRLVQDLQAQDLFPGLRGLKITLEGTQTFVDKGLVAVSEINASRAAKGLA